MSVLTPIHVTDDRDAYCLLDAATRMRQLVITVAVLAVTQ
jgi:hypothetical protein